MYYEVGHGRACFKLLNYRKKGDFEKIDSKKKEKDLVYGYGRPVL